jgi:hypothetical protein
MKCWTIVRERLGGTITFHERAERAKRADPFRNPSEVLLGGSLLLIIVAPAEEHSGTKCQNEFGLDEVRGLLETKTYSGEHKG